MKAKWISIFAAGVAAGGGSVVTYDTLAAASAGDAIYEAPAAETCITAAQAACFADCAIAAGSWAGARGDMIGTNAQVSQSCATGYSSTTSGTRTAPLNEVPVGSQLHGVVTEP
jgi:hypothetical protein